MVICNYLLPFRRASFCDREIAKLASYLEMLAQAGCEVVVIDGSPAEVFLCNDDLLREVCLHQPVDRRFGYLNDKVNGIHTGIALATRPKIVLADDDIRYTSATLQRVLSLLDDFDVVRPQNFLRPLPWWGRMEAARMLVNRATLPAADYPGTCAFWKTVMLETGNYDGDVLFDNEEMIRHFASHGCMIAYASDLFVRKRPPVFRKWLEQRPRQAYEDFGLRAKTALFLVLLPLLLAAGLLYGGKGIGIYLGAIALLPFLLAYRGRARGRASDFFPLQCCLFAPLWILERALSTYWALYWYLTRGGYPFGDQLLAKGIGRDWRSGGRILSRQIRRAKNCESRPVLG